jgi:hypothetical protein
MLDDLFGVIDFFILSMYEAGINSWECNLPGESLDSFFFYD